MNKKELISKIAVETGISEETCRAVLDTAEKIIQKELGSTGALSEAFGKIGGAMAHFFGGDKQA
ncbi:MAG: HU family DNA-binding protein [Planctomycetes bacterium]|nr:HU family DNA-binding protein [Planctomycetota bacterium]